MGSCVSTRGRSCPEYHGPDSIPESRRTVTDDTSSIYHDGPLEDYIYEDVGNVCRTKPNKRSQTKPATSRDRRSTSSEYYFPPEPPEIIRELGPTEGTISTHHSAVATTARIPFTELISHEGKSSRTSKTELDGNRVAFCSYSQVHKELRGIPKENAPNACISPEIVDRDLDADVTSIRSPSSRFSYYCGLLYQNYTTNRRTRDVATLENRVVPLRQIIRASREDNMHTIDAIGEAESQENPYIPLVRRLTADRVFAWMTVGPEGGSLTLLEPDITMFVPSGALSQGDYTNVVLCKSTRRADQPELQQNQTLASDVFHCLPHGTRFHKSVVIRFALKPEVNGNITVLYSPTDLDEVTLWRELPLDGTQGDQSIIATVTDDDHACLLAKTFCLFCAVEESAEPSDGNPVPFFTQAVVFAKVYQTRTECRVKFTIVLADDSQLQDIQSRALAMSQGKQVAMQAFKVVCLSEPIRVHVRSPCEEWRLSMTDSQTVGIDPQAVLTKQKPSYVSVLRNKDTSESGDDLLCCYFDLHQRRSRVTIDVFNSILEMKTSMIPPSTPYPRLGLHDSSTCAMQTTNGVWNMPPYSQPSLTNPSGMHPQNATMDRIAYPTLQKPPFYAASGPHLPMPYPGYPRYPHVYHVVAPEDPVIPKADEQSSSQQIPGAAKDPQGEIPDAQDLTGKGVLGDVVIVDDKTPKDRPLETRPKFQEKPPCEAQRHQTHNKHGRRHSDSYLFSRQTETDSERNGTKVCWEKDQPDQIRPEQQPDLIGYGQSIVDEYRTTVTSQPNVSTIHMPPNDNNVRNIIQNFLTIIQPGTDARACSDLNRMLGQAAPVHPKLPIAIRQMICPVLDGKRADYSDWRGFADKLGLLHLRECLNNQQSPTDELLNMWETFGKPTSELIQALKDIGQVPLAESVSDHLESTK